LLHRAADDSACSRGYGPAVDRDGVRVRLERVPPVALDAALAAVVAVAISFAIGAEQEPGSKSPDALAYLLGVAIAAPLLLRRRWPLGVLLASTVVALMYHALDYPAIGVALPLAVAYFSAAVAGRIWPAAIVAVGLHMFAVGFRAVEEDERLVTVIGSGTIEDLVLVAAVLLLGEALRTRRAWMAEVEERLRRTDIEREREAARRVEQERLRIAHELHDVLAHTVALIGVQAGVAAEALDESPAEAQTALRRIREQSREALTELKATVGVLRGPRDGAPRSPAPRLSQLQELVETAARAGVQVDLSVSGTVRALPAIVDLAAYRIVQESLTNVVRHAGVSRATVLIDYEPDAVVVQVEDDGRGVANGRAAMAEGHGLVGMRERAAATGGRLEAGPAPEPGRGFRVRAWLPTDRASA
jgi:signal transduction histidine kinase